MTRAHERGWRARLYLSAIGLRSAPRFRTWIDDERHLTLLGLFGEDGVR